MSFFKSPIEIIELHNGMTPERDPRSCEPGDAILFESQGVAYTLLEELMRDSTHVTWRTLITAHWDEAKVGTEEWVGLNLAKPLLEGGVIVRGY